MRLPNRDTRPVDVPPGPLLGIDPDAVYPLAEIPLTTGLMLAFYTDGLVERPGVDLDDSIADLAQRLARADDQDMDLLIDNLLQQAGSPSQRIDDIALLVLHIGAIATPAGRPPPGVMPER